MNNSLQAKIKTLPPAVEAYLTSIKADNLNVLIADKYNLTLPQIRAFADLVAQLFLREIPVVGLAGAIRQLFGFNDTVARQMACDIAGVRLLVVADWLGADVAGLISSWGGDPAKYQNYVTVQQEAVVKEADWLAKQLAEPVDEVPVAEEEEEEDETIDWQDREEKVKILFTQNLVDTLRADDEDLLNEINSTIFYLLADTDLSLKDRLANLLLNNQELLTSQRIVVDGRQVEATVANWLAYFISQKGSALFDAVTLSDFITNSPNAKFLDFDEKKLLSNLLIVYRNLKFFPDSLPGPDPKYWMIFPVAVPEEPLTKTAAAVNENNIKPTQPLPAAKPQAFQSATQVVSAEPAPTALRARQIAETESLLARYPAGSLERLALEEELAKLKQQ